MTKRAFKNLNELKEFATPLIENQLDTWLQEQDGPQNGLIQAARYSTLGSGKRFRPLLTLCVAQHYGVDIEQAVPAACAIELVHTYSLIHDDLPCMDNDDFRRGKKSLHKVIGEGLALLTGDFLLTYAFDRLCNAHVIPPNIRLKLIQHLSLASGHLGMVGGQYADLTSHQHPQTKEFINWMHECKTGALMKASVVFGALLACVNDDQVAQWGNFGASIGLLFQLVDDLLDIFATTNTGSLPIGPSSYIAFAGIEQTLSEVRQLKLQLLKRCHELLPENLILQELIESITHQYEDLPQIIPSMQ